MKLSEHFDLEEFRVSQRFPELAARIEFSGHDRHKCFLLARMILEPVRERLGCPVRITSGKRTEELNRAVGGVPGSEHLFRDFSAAADFTVDPARRSLLHEVPPLLPAWSFGQVILYLGEDRRPRFVHVSLPTPGRYGERLLKDGFFHYWKDGKKDGRRTES